ncbi:MAG: glycerate kinase [Roseburia porci]|nr:glycerate kinase [Roseburia porci]
MRVTIAIDSFKGSLSSIEAGQSASEGILRVFPDASVQVCPIADGGEGTVLALTSGMGGELHDITVTGPLSEPVLCHYGIFHNSDETSQAPSKTAIIEMSGAAGITLVPENRRNPLYTTTYGVGEVISDAIQNGCRNFIIGIGGSATNDGGVGMLQALGFQFLDKNNQPIPRGAIGLKDLASIHCEQVLPELKDCHFRIACDVTNPLCGTNGCSAIFGPQKGASPDMISEMDHWLKNYARIACPAMNSSTCNNSDFPGAGAAGGLGFAFHVFLNAALEPGIDIVLEETHLEDFIKNSDIVITGEGRLDDQTAMGKAPVGVARIAKRYDLPVIALSGCVTDGAHVCNASGIDAFFPILKNVVTREEAMSTETARKNLADTAEQIFRLIHTCFLYEQNLKPGFSN